MARPTMLASARGELYTRSPPKAFCSPQVTLKTPPLPFTSARLVLAAGVGYVLPEDHDPGIPRHLVLEAAVEQVDHRGRIAGEARIVLGIELLRGGIDVRRIDVLVDRVERGLG